MAPPADEVSPLPIEIGICVPRGRDNSSVLANESFKLATLRPLTFDGRPISLREFSVLGDEYARGRNGIVDQFKSFERDTGIALDYLLWWDDDVVLPPETITQLLSTRAAIASGVYFMRKPPFLPVAYRESTDPDCLGRFWNLDTYPDNAVIEVDAAGMGCCLIRRDVFDHLSSPYFAWQDVYRDERNTYQLKRDNDPNADIINPEWTAVEDRTMGEDLYFFTRARQAGYRVMLNTNVICGHVGQFIYDATVFRNAEARYHKIAPAGRLNVLILPAPSPKPWDGNILHNEPLGGSESAAGYLAEYLANRHHHIVYCVSGSAANLINGVHYRPHEQTYILAAQPWDVVIVSRWTDVLEMVSSNPAVKAVIFWAHDIIPQRATITTVYNWADAFVALTPFHASITFSEDEPGRSEWMSEVIMPNGVDMSLFDDQPDVERIPGRLIWTSNPNRGLFSAVRIFRQLRRRWPMLEFHIYGRASVYGWGTDAEEPYLPEPSEPNVYVHEPLNKADLALELRKSWAFFYPTHWVESSCLAVLESQAAGTPVIVNPMGALVDTVQGGLFTWRFENAIERLLNPDEWSALSMKGKEWARVHDWGVISDKWEEVMRGEVEKWHRRKALDEAGVGRGRKVK